MLTDISTLIAAVAGLAALSAIVALYYKLSHILSRQRQWTWEVANNSCWQLEALLALYKDLDLPKSLPPMRGWAASPDFLRNLMQCAEDHRPGTIVECSSGVSTLVLGRQAQLNGAGHVYSLEHDAAFAQKTRLLLRRFDLEEFATVYHAPLTNTLLGDWDGSWYDTRVLPELVTVDLW